MPVFITRTRQTPEWVAGRKTEKVGRNHFPGGLRATVDQLVQQAHACQPSANHHPELVGRVGLAGSAAHAFHLIKDYY